MLGFTVGRDAEAPHRLQRSPLAWSFTRHRLLNGPRRCERAIFWRYVGSRGGHDAHRATPDARAAWVLRHLTSLSVLLGTVLHTALRQAVIAVVDDRRRPDARRLLDGARFTLNHVWRSSRGDFAERFWRMPGVYPALQEVVYAGSVPRRDVAAVRSGLARRITHLVAAPLLKDLEQDYRSEVFVGDAYPASYGEPTPEGDVAVWVAPDLVDGHRTAGSPRALGRWRRDPAWCVTTLTGTGREDDGRLLAHGEDPTGPADATPRPVSRTEAPGIAPVAADRTDPEDFALERLRLAVAGRWLAARGVPRARGAYLGRAVDVASGTERWWDLGDAELAWAGETIRADMSRLRVRFADGDPRRPLTAEHWPQTTDAATCATCVFRMLCERDGRTNPTGTTRPAEAATRGATREATRAATGREAAP